MSTTSTASPASPATPAAARTGGTAGDERQDLDLEFAAAGGRIRLVGRGCRWPYVVGKLFVDPVTGRSAAGSAARGPRAGTLVVQQAGGGAHPGDVRRQRVAVGEGVHPRVLGQGAVLVHGVAGRPPAVETVHLGVRSGGGLLHRPGVRVLLPGARLRQRLSVVLEPGASVVTVDATVLHPDCLRRSAPGPVLDSLLEVATARGGEPVVVERTRLEGLPPSSRGWPAFAVVHLLVPDAAGGAGSPSSPALPPFPGATGAPGSLAVSALSSLPGRAGTAVRICARDGAALRSAVDAAVAWTEQVLAP